MAQLIKRQPLAWLNTIALALDLAVLFGVHLTAEQSGGIIAVIHSFALAVGWTQVTPVKAPRLPNGKVLSPAYSPRVNIQATGIPERLAELIAEAIEREAAGSTTALGDSVKASFTKVTTMAEVAGEAQKAVTPERVNEVMTKAAEREADTVRDPRSPVPPGPVQVVKPKKPAAKKARPKPE